MYEAGARGASPQGCEPASFMMPVRAAGSGTSGVLPSIAASRLFMQHSEEGAS